MKTQLYVIKTQKFGTNFFNYQVVEALDDADAYEYAISISQSSIFHCWKINNPFLRDSLDKLNLEIKLNPQAFLAVKCNIIDF